MIPESIAKQKNKAYDANPRRILVSTCSADEREMIENSLFKIDDNVLYWFETVYQTKESIGVMHEKVIELTKDMDGFVYVVDLTRARKPDAEARQELKKMFDLPNLKFVCMFTETNLLLRVAAKFVLSSVFGNRSFEFYRTFREALERAIDEAR